MRVSSTAKRSVTVERSCACSGRPLMASTSPFRSPGLGGAKTREDCVLAVRVLGVEENVGPWFPGPDGAQRVHDGAGFGSSLSAAPAISTKASSTAWRGRSYAFDTLTLATMNAAKFVDASDDLLQPGRGELGRHVLTSARCGPAPLQRKACRTTPISVGSRAACGAAVSESGPSRPRASPRARPCIRSPRRGARGRS